MKVLVTGGSSLLGQYLLRHLPAGVDAHFTWWTVHQPWTQHQMDVCDPSQVSYVFGRVRPEAVVHMASAGDVDWCEANYQAAWRINVDGTRNVLAAARDCGAKVLLTSTNAVYDGSSPPYREDSPRDPINAYGKMRRKAEDLVMDYLDGWQVVRLFLLYGWEPPGARGNWGSKLLRALEAGKPVRMVDDVLYQPTWAADAARAVWKALLELPEGACNVAGDTTCSLYEFAVQAARVCGASENLVTRCSIHDFDLAPRPRDTSYDLAKSRGLGLACRGYAEGLEAFRDECP